jgi:hypothetical protein
MEEGKEVHRGSRALFPDGVLVNHESPLTLELLAAPATVTLFAAPLAAHGCVAHADILTRCGWKPVAETGIGPGPAFPSFGRPLASSTAAAAESMFTFFI